MMRVVFSIILLFCFGSCTNRSHIPDKIIRISQMGDIMWDLIRADLLAHEIIKKDSTKNLNTETVKLTEKIFAIHHVDKLQFEKSLQFYAKRPDMMTTIFDTLDARKVRHTFLERQKIKTLQKNALR